jgi:prevent-host-death family protein
MEGTCDTQGRQSCGKRPGERRPRAGRRPVRLARGMWSEYIDHIRSREDSVPKKSRSMAKLLTSSTTPALPATLFKAKCAETMDAVHELQRSLLITKHGKPLVRVSPVEDVAPNPIGFMQGTVVAAGDLIAPDHESWDESGSDPLTGRS